MGSLKSRPPSPLGTHVIIVAEVLPLLQGIRESREADQDRASPGGLQQGQVLQ